MKLKTLPLFLFFAPAASFSADLKVTLSPIESGAGHVLWSLFSVANSFPDNPSRTGKLAATPGSEIFTISGITPGSYALSVFHDANDNGKLDTDLLGRPTEMFGLSNITQVLWAQPKWDDVKFEVQDGENSISILMKYQ